ncbi:4a-hydroxytetrahydrobiopterin dehydratase [Lacinutrix chionoecetis]
MSKLSEKEIKKHLEKLPEWNYADDAIHTEYEFNNFKDCFSAMSRIAFECEALNHHPDWANTYNILNISLSTHDAKGVTLKDIKLARAIEGIIDDEE